MSDTDGFPRLSAPDQHTYPGICLKGLRLEPELRKTLLDKPGSLIFLMT